MSRSFLLTQRVPKVLATFATCLVTFAIWWLVPLTSAAERPNILWITAEDMSPVLGCYGDKYAITPHIDKLATQSVKYTHAFATAPVCSPSRSTLITGCYATSLGTHQMRSAFPIPDEITGFPSYLRKAGFYTTNNAKTDYNTANWKKIVEASWDESSNKAHWRNNPDKNKPFFSIFNLMTSHQSRAMVWPYEQFQKEVQSRLTPQEIHDPAKAPVPPYYPDTPVIRKTLARFYDCVTAMDKEVGEILQQLEEDGLADDTIVFFYSDHGSGLPRHKRCLYDSGMHVPLLIRFPEKWKHLAPKDGDNQLTAGDTTDRLVSFVDFGPTLLSLLEVDIPEYMQGEPFLGKAETKPREFVFGHRDRVDEVIDMSRSIRSKRYLFIRNYMPHLGWNQRTAWPDQGEIRHEFYRLTDREKMTDAQWQFAGPRRPDVELYDCDRDPLNLDNLAESHPTTTRKFDEVLITHQENEFDFGCIPEIQFRRLTKDSLPSRDLLQKRVIWRVALVQQMYFLLAEHGNIPPDEDRFGESSAQVKCWVANSLARAEKLSGYAKTFLSKCRESKLPELRIASASTLVGHGDLARGLPTLTEELQSDDLTTVLYAARAIELLGPDAKAAIPAMKKTLARVHKIRPPDTPATVVTSGDQDLAMFIGFSVNAFLKAAEANGEQGPRGDHGKAGIAGRCTTELGSPAPQGAAACSPGRELGVSRPSRKWAERSAPIHAGGLPRPDQSAEGNVNGVIRINALIDSASTNDRALTTSSARPLFDSPRQPGALAAFAALDAATPQATCCRPLRDWSTTGQACLSNGDTCDDNSEPDDDNSMALFDGKTLDGWSARAKGDVVVKDGEIQILSKGANLWLVHEGEFADFELTIEAKMPDDAYNSGIGFRCTGKGKPKGYQCEVDRAKSGMIYAIGSGWVWPKGNDETEKFKQMAGNCFNNDDWNHFKIRCNGDHIQIWINGTKTADVHDDRFAKGSIALQHHGKGGVHRFRNVKIKPLE